MSNTQGAALVGLIGSTLGGWGGAQCFAPAKKQPEKTLELYDIELSPYCRLVRELLSEMDIDVMIYPCPGGGKRFRPKVAELGGKMMFPFLHDPNTGVKMNESADILEYLGKTYQRRVKGTRGFSRNLKLAGSFSMSILRYGHGMKARPSKAPAQPLELYSFEASPFSRPVREVLCELEIPYLLRNTAKAVWKDMGPPSFRDNLFKGEKGTSRNRRALVERTGQVQVPYLIDANTGVAMYESGDIIDYLNRTYAL